MNYFFLLFEGFETLDLFGPVEIFSKTPDAKLRYISMDGGTVSSAQGAQIVTEKAEMLPENSVLLVPGGMGTRLLSRNAEFLEKLAALAPQADFVLSVCTGSALLAAAGVIEGRRATSNKMAFEWVRTTGSAEWEEKARWVRDGRFYTSSGVSAGIDMALGFAADRYGRELAESIARRTEYIWNSDPDNDPFAK